MAEAKKIGVGFMMTLQMIFIIILNERDRLMIQQEVRVEFLLPVTSRQAAKALSLIVAAQADLTLTRDPNVRYGSKVITSGAYEPTSAFGPSLAGAEQPLMAQTKLSPTE